jgi:hypothetical protein
VQSPFLHGRKALGEVSWCGAVFAGGLVLIGAFGSKVPQCYTVHELEEKLGRLEFHLGIGPYWLRFTYVTPVLIKKYMAGSTEFLTYAAGCGAGVLALLLSVKHLERTRARLGEYSDAFVRGGHSKRLRFAYPALSGLIGGQTGRCRSHGGLHLLAAAILCSTARSDGTHGLFAGSACAWLNNWPRILHGSAVLCAKGIAEVLAVQLDGHGQLDLPGLWLLVRTAPSFVTGPPNPPLQHRNSLLHRMYGGRAQVAAMLGFIVAQIHTMAVAMRYYDNMYHLRVISIQTEILNWLRFPTFLRAGIFLYRFYVSTKIRRFPILNSKISYSDFRRFPELT